MGGIFGNLFGDSDKEEKMRELDEFLRKQGILQQQMQPPGFPPSFSTEEQDRLDELQRQRVVDTHELKIQAFLQQPTEIREEILAIMRHNLVRSVIRSLGEVEVQPTQEEIDLEVKKAQTKFSLPQGFTSMQFPAYHSGISSLEEFASSLRYRSDEIPENIPSYSELLKAHTDKTAEECLLGDKNK